MANVINATSTGNGGLVSQGDDSGILNIQTNETTAITVDASQRVAFVAGTAALPAITTTGDTNTGIFFPAADTIAFSEGGSEAMRIDSSGNVGIGTTTPARRLHVRQGGVTTLANTNGSLFTDAGNAGVLLGSDNVLGYISGVTAAGTATVDLVLQPFGGSVMAGTTNPTPAGSGDTKGISLWSNGSSSQIFSTGNNDTCAVFNRAGSDGATVRLRRQGSDVGSISTTASATAYNTSSDYRLKDNVQPMTGALAKVALLKPVTYKWKVDGSDGEGFIAHELAEVKPDCVSGDKDAVDADGNPVYQGIDTSFLVATLTAAIQELKAINDTQTETINALTARIVALEQA